jgi:hypothetical protein
MNGFEDASGTAGIEDGNSPCASHHSGIYQGPISEESWPQIRPIENLITPFCGFNCPAQIVSL